MAKNLRNTQVVRKIAREYGVPADCIFNSITSQHRTIWFHRAEIRNFLRAFTATVIKKVPGAEVQYSPLKYPNSSVIVRLPLTF